MLEQWHSIFRRTKIVTHSFFARHLAYKLHILLSSQGSYFAPHLQGWAQVAVWVLCGLCYPTQSWLDQLWICDSCWANQNPYPECLGLGLEDSSSFWISLLKGGDLQLLAITDYYSKVLSPQWPQELFIGYDGTGRSNAWRLYSSELDGYKPGKLSASC